MLTDTKLCGCCMANLLDEMGCARDVGNGSLLLDAGIGLLDEDSDLAAFKIPDNVTLSSLYAKTFGT